MPDNKIYSLVDIELLEKYNFSLDKLLQNINSIKSNILQYRDKKNSFQEKLKNIQYIRKNFNGSIIINDDINLINYCDGLHIGQSDILKYNSSLEKAISQIRNLIGNKKLGLSTHNKKEILKANLLNIDYIGLGSYRNTKTKKDINILGESIFPISKYSKYPVAIIGGVKRNDIFPKNIRYKVIGKDLIF